MTDLPSKTEQLRAMREASIDPLMIPDELKVENRKPVPSEEHDKLLAALRGSVVATRKSSDERSAVLKVEMEKTKKAKTAGRIAKMKAKKSGEAKKMPLSGKDALKAIRKPLGKTASATKKPTQKKASVKPHNEKTVRSGTKTAMVANLLRRSNGCTTADVLKATGWPSVSMPAMARAIGVKLAKEKDGSVTRYRVA